MQNRIQPIEESRKTIATLVQERIRDAILSGFLVPGSRIDQNQLASDLNVSLVPVREALKKLEGEGFVQIVPRRGAFITATSLEDMEDLYFTRRLLEGQAAYHAADKLKDEDIAKMENLIRVMDEALSAHDNAQFMSANRDFHFIIYDAVGSQYLNNMINSLWELAQRYRYRYLLLQNPAAELRAEHEAILAACRARAPRALRDAVMFHMEQTLNGVQGYLQTQSESKKKGK